MNKKIIVYKSINETCSFYFENLDGGSCRPMYSLVTPDRMNEIFDQCLNSDMLSTQNINKINKWKKEHGFE